MDNPAPLLAAVMFVVVGVVALVVVFRVTERDKERALTLHLARIDAQTRIAQAPYTPQAPMLTHLTHSPHLQYQLTGGAGPERVPLADPVVAESAVAALAPAPTFATLLAQGIIGPGRPLITGYSEGQAITGALADWRSGAIAGLPGSGKTTTQRFIAAQAALQGARLVILDPHMYKGADSLAGTLAPLAPAFLCDPAERPRDMLRALRLVTDILQGRLGGKPVDFPLFVFVDEFTALMARSDLAEPLATLLEMIAQEGRASLVQGAISGQIWTAARSGGSALRDSLASTYVHRMKPGQARVLLPADDARRAATLPTGAAVLWRADGTIADVVIPLTTAADMVTTGRLLATVPATRAANIVNSTATTVATPPPPPVADAVSQSSPNARAVSPAQERALELFLAHKSMAKVVLIMDGIDSSQGSTYQRAVTRRSADVAAAMAAYVS